MKIGIVGGGIFSWSFLWSLNKLDLKNQVREIILFKNDKKYQPCSLSSTAVIARRSLDWGNSELGKLIQQSWYFWEYLLSSTEISQMDCIVTCPIFYDKEQLDQWSKANFIQNLKYRSLSLNSKTKNVGVERAILVRPDQFIFQLQTLVEKKFHMKNIVFKIVEDDILNVDIKSSVINTKKTQSFNFDGIILQPGAHIENHLEIKNCHLDEILPGNREVVYGAYYEFTGNDTEEYLKQSFDQTFVYKKKDYQIIVDVDFQSVKLGVVSSKIDNKLFYQDELNKMLHIAESDGWNLKSLKTVKLKAGARHKIAKRTPKIFHEGDTFFHLGGYKIGYLVSFFQSFELARKILGSKKYKLI